MTKRLLVSIAFIAVTAGNAIAQDAGAVAKAALAAMGGDGVRNIQYSGVGYNSAVGQAFDVSSSPVEGVPPPSDQNYPRFEITRYTRTIDFDTMSSSENLTRRQGNYPARGGGPVVGNEQIVSMVRGNLAWNLQGTNVVPAPALAEIRQLEILLTPLGFLRGVLAAGPNATAFRRRHMASMDALFPGKPVTIVSFIAFGKYRINGTINEQNLVENVQTWVPSPVLGDMLYEVDYEDYKDFVGLMYPSVAHAHQGNRLVTVAHDAWEIRIADVKKNVNMPLLDVPDAVKAAKVPAVRTESQELAKGVWLIGGGTHNSVAVEFADFVAVVEAPLDEARSLAVIAEVRRLAPNKPIRYVVNTHHHFDHSGGLRTYVSEGATIVTHRGNRAFYENVVLSPAPRTLAPDRLSLYPIPTGPNAADAFETLTQQYAITDGERILEVHAIQGLDHSAHMLIAYLPAEKILINADLYSPPAPGSQSPASPMREMIALNQNILRLKLDVAYHAPIHGRMGTHAEFLRLVGEGRN